MIDKEKMKECADRTKKNERELPPNWKYWGTRLVKHYRPKTPVLRR